MPSPAETTTTTKTTLIAYLKAEKVTAAARMRQVLRLRLRRVFDFIFIDGKALSMF